MSSCGNLDNCEEEEERGMIAILIIIVFLIWLFWQILKWLVMRDNTPQVLFGCGVVLVVVGIMAWALLDGLKGLLLS